jgi:hypothetical protein
VFGLLILMTEDGCYGFGKVLGDELGGELWECREMSPTNGSEKSRGDRTAQSSVIVAGQLSSRFVESQNAVGLMEEWLNGDRP